jgi:hypothetical protein
MSFVLGQGVMDQITNDGRDRCLKSLLNIRFAFPSALSLCLFIGFNAGDDRLNKALCRVRLGYAPSVEEPISVTVSGHSKSRYRRVA